MEPPHISPEPDDMERRAILAALEAEKAEHGEEAPLTTWADLLLPVRDGEEPEP